MAPIDFTNEIVNNFKSLWKELDIKYDIFIRTTDEKHKAMVKKVFSKLLSQGDIYKGQYQGQYCVSCEEFLTSSQIDKEGICLVCLNKPKTLQEETYFFKVSKYTDFLKKYLSNHQDFCCQ